MKRNKLTLWAVVAAATVGLAACGTATQTTTSKDKLAGLKVDKSQVKCGLGTGKPATGAPIAIRALVSASGGVDFTSSPKSASAFFSCVNANGGINGRPIDYKYSDDALNPQNSSAIAAGFANDPNVVALAGDATFIGCQQANDQYVKKNLYSITGVGVPRSCFHSSNIAPINAGPRISALSTVQYFASQGKAKRIGLIGVTIPGTGDWEVEGVEGYAKQNGLQVVKTLLHNPGLQDAQQYVTRIKSADPDLFLIMDPASDAVASLKVGQTLGLKDKFHWACLASCYDASLPGQIGTYWNDSFVANSELQLVDASTPDNLLWRQVLEAYGEPSYPRDTFSQAGFLSAKILTETLLKLDPAKIDRATVSKAILGIKNYRSDMLCAPWYYGEATEHNANHSTRMVIVKNGVYVAAGSCVDAQDPDLTAIRAAEQAQGLVG
ncbi:ABC transporter substrate-binding protein [Nonomuraea sp. 3N208]|uniref:ABC transporter substrate-binding protein n=1 Tax=Nonomuraea sp. 3N208 TaxID=3457421 RepID=UPI003FD02E73